MINVEICEDYGLFLIFCILWLKWIEIMWMYVCLELTFFFEYNF